MSDERTDDTYYFQQHGGERIIDDKEYWPDSLGLSMPRAEAQKMIEVMARHLKDADAGYVFYRLHGELRRDENAKPIKAVFVYEAEG